MSPVVGVINMCGTKHGCSFLLKTMHDMGYRVFVVERDQPILQIVKASRIRRWILTGTTMHRQDVPPVPIELFSLGKLFLLICYSFESVLQQYGCPLLYRPIKTEYTKLAIPPIPLFKGIPSQMRVYRNHQLYIPSKCIKPPLRLLSSHEGEAMIVYYKNMLLTQFHPERSAHGRILLKNWLHSI
jgi:anthranilate/para-aminobenzoate synthase component II